MYCWRAGAKAGGGVIDLKFKTILKICWKSSSKYQAIEDKAKTIGRAKTGAKVGACDMVRVLLPSMGAAPVSLFLALKKGFEKEYSNWAIGQDKELWCKFSKLLKVFLFFI